MLLGVGGHSADGAGKTRTGASDEQQMKRLAQTLESRTGQLRETLRAIGANLQILARSICNPTDHEAVVAIAAAAIANAEGFSPRTRCSLSPPTRCSLSPPNCCSLSPPTCCSLTLSDIELLRQQADWLEKALTLVASLLRSYAPLVSNDDDDDDDDDGPTPATTAAALTAMADLAASATASCGGNQGDSGAAADSLSDRGIPSKPRLSSPPPPAPSTPPRSACRPLRCSSLTLTGSSLGTVTHSSLGTVTHSSLGTVTHSSDICRGPHTASDCGSCGPVNPSMSTSEGSSSEACFGIPHNLLDAPDRSTTVDVAVGGQQPAPVSPSPSLLPHSYAECPFCDNQLGSRSVGGEPGCCLCDVGGASSASSPAAGGASRATLLSDGDTSAVYHLPARNLVVKLWRFHSSGRLVSEADARREVAMTAAVARASEALLTSEAAAATDSTATSTPTFTPISTPTSTSTSSCTPTSDPTFTAPATTSATGVLAAPANIHIFAQPIHVMVRARTHVETDGDFDRFDREMLAAYPHFSGGDAGTRLRCRTTQLVRAAKGAAAAGFLTEGAVERIAELAAADVYDLGVDMFWLVDRVHRLGFILSDHKLANMVYDEARGCHLLIDAEAVRPCPPGTRLPGPWHHTLEFAAPEQWQGEASELWSDSSSDVYACGTSMREAINICRDVFASALCPAEDDAVQAAFTARIRPLQQLMGMCADRYGSPAARPSAAVVLGQLQSLQQREGRR